MPEAGKVGTALQFGTLSQALRQAGVADDLARAAAEEIAAYEDRLGGLERQLDQRFHALAQAMDQRFRALAQEMDRRFHAVDRRIDELRGYVDPEIAVLGVELRFQRWVNVTTLGVAVAVLVKLFVH